MAIPINTPLTCFIECYTFYLGTLAERILSDTRHAGWNGHACQPCAARERIPPDACHTVRDRNARQSIAPLECIIADARYAAVIRDDAVLAAKHQRARRRLDQAVSRAVVDGVPRGDGDTFQPATTVERIISDVRHAVRYRHTR